MSDDVPGSAEGCEQPSDRDLLHQIFELLYFDDVVVEGGRIPTLNLDKSWDADTIDGIDAIVRPLFAGEFPKYRVSVVIHRDSIFADSPCHEVPTDLAASAVTRDCGGAFSIARGMHECGLGMVVDDVQED